MSRTYQPYQIVFTDLARAFTSRRASLSALEEQIRGEIAEFMTPEQSEPPMAIDELMFHVVEADGQEYICSPAQGGGETVLLVDTCSREEVAIAEGPIAGKIMLVPQADSEDR